MATPVSIFSGTTENETGPRKMNVTAGGKPKSKFALQDRSNVVLKKASSRLGTPKKAFGVGNFSLTVHGKGKQENQYRAAKPSKLFSEDKNKSKSFCGIDQIGEYENKLPEDLSTEQQASLDEVKDDENQEDLPVPEKIHVPLESDFDYYSSIPSPSDKLSTYIIHEDCFEEGSGGPSDEPLALKYPFEENTDDPTRCMSPVVVRPMNFGVFAGSGDNASATNF